MKRVSMFLIMLIMFVSIGFTNVSAMSFSYQVTPIFENHQIDKSKSYYDLKVEKGETLKLSFEVLNRVDKENTIYVTPANAYTSMYGGIQYSKDNGNDYAKYLDESFAIKDLIKVPSEIHLQPNERKVVEFEVQVPDADMGTYLCALIFSEEFGAKSDNNIENKVEFVIGIQLNFDNQDTDNIQIKGATTEITGNGPLVLLSVENHSAKITEGLSGSYQVYEKGKNEPLFDGKFNLLKMAPKTSVFTPLLWNAPSYDEGEYDLKVNLEYEGEMITYEGGFEISKESLTRYNNGGDYTSPVLQEDNGFEIPWWIWLIILLVIILVLVFVYFNRKMKNMQNQFKSMQDKEKLEKDVE